MAQTNASASTASGAPVVKSATPGILGLFDSSIGQKAIMAVTGLILVGFLIGHFLGNALIYAGPDALNAYSAMLHASPGLLWTARLVLLASIALHIWAALRLYAKNTAARPQAYRVKRDVATNYAARTMMWSGPLLLAFLIYHLLHLTFHATPTSYTHSVEDVYSNVVHGFSIPWLSLFYVAAQVALGYHLFHGVWSMLQTLGANHSAYNAKLRQAAVGIALFITIGNISIPLAVLLGIVR